MGDILIRGVPRQTRSRIQRKAESQNLSMNQFLLRFIQENLREEETEEEKRRRHEEAFRRMDEIRGRLRRKYGRFDDSTKLIREDRESR